jgi:hypothetical protein
MPTGHRPCPPRLDAAVACGSSGSGPVSGRAPHQLPCPRWLPQGSPVSALVAGVRAAAGHTSGPEIAADTGLATSAGHQPCGGRSSRKQRTVPPIVPARYSFLYSSSSWARDLRGYRLGLPDLVVVSELPGVELPGRPPCDLRIDCPLVTVVVRSVQPVCGPSAAHTRSGPVRSRPSLGAVVHRSGGAERADCRAAELGGRVRRGDVGPAPCSWLALRRYGARRPELRLRRRGGGAGCRVRSRKRQPKPVTSLERSRRSARALPELLVTSAS